MESKEHHLRVSLEVAAEGYPLSQIVGKFKRIREVESNNVQIKYAEGNRSWVAWRFLEIYIDLVGNSRVVVQRDAQKVDLIYGLIEVKLDPANEQSVFAVNDGLS
jgi:hypothetical protein